MLRNVRKYYQYCSMAGGTVAHQRYQDRYQSCICTLLEAAAKIGTIGQECRRAEMHECRVQ